MELTVTVPPITLGRKVGQTKHRLSHHFRANRAKPMDALLGLLTSPSRMPLWPMASLGFFGTLDLRWIVTMVLTGLFVPIATAIERFW
jgi:hypothetical protein